MERAKNNRKSMTASIRFVKVKNTDNDNRGMKNNRKVKPTVINPIFQWLSVKALG